MPEVTIRLRINPETGKKDIIISMRGDEDALPHEHEQQHRIIADKIVQGGLAKAGELGKIVVERVDDEKEPAIPAGNERQGERQAQQSGH